MREIKNNKFQVRLPMVLMVGIAVGILIGATISQPSSPMKSPGTNVVKFREIVSHIDQDYVDEVNTEKLVEDAINDMLEHLDPHTVYIPASDAELYNSQLQGNFEGIGVQFDIIRDTITVIAALNGGPSEKLGIRSGDRIIEVDGENVAGIGINIRGVVDRLRGPKGSTVDVVIKRPHQAELLEFTITRDKIPQHSVDVSYMVNDEIGYIKINNFSSTTADEFRNALKELVAKGMQKLILDLQGNPGGYMDAAVEVCDELLNNEHLIVSRKSRKSRYNMESRAHKKGLFEEGPVIVLINEGSASASEIVAGALQDNDRALIVGRRSFGKGLVQMPITLSDNSELRLTIARYFTPSGRSIQKPYQDSANYEGDITERYYHGEFFHADSIKFNDSLKYKTSSGRTVYGGGGIMPDHFVAYDTTLHSDYYNKLIGSSSIRDFAITYYQDHKEELESKNFREYLHNFEVTDSMLRKLIDLAESSGVDYNEEQFNRSKERVKVDIKSLIARSIWDAEGFYKIYNTTNEIFQEAMKHFDHAEKLVMAHRTNE